MHHDLHCSAKQKLTLDFACLLSANHNEVIVSVIWLHVSLNIESHVISEWLLAKQLIIYNKVLHNDKLWDVSKVANN